MNISEPQIKIFKNKKINLQEMLISEKYIKDKDINNILSKKSLIQIY